MPGYVTSTASGKLAGYHGETMIAMHVNAAGKAAIESAALANGTIDITYLSELTSFELARTTFTAEADEALGKIDVAADEDPTTDTDGETVAGIVIARQTGGADASRIVVAAHTWTARPGNAADAVAFSETKGFGTWTPAPGAIVRGIGLVRPDAEGIIDPDELVASLDLPDSGGTATTGTDVALDALPSIRGVSRTTILTDAERTSAGLGEWLDGTAGRIAHPDGTIYLFSCELDGTDNVIVRTTVGGTADAPTITGNITRSSAMTGVPSGAVALGGTVYYDSANDQLLMVTHTNRDATDPGAAGSIWSCVGIAKSTNWGTSWSYLGDVVTPGVAISDPDVGPNVIGSFSTYIIDTDPADGLDYIVIFHADQRADATKVYQSVSRCPLDDFLADCDAGTAPTFSKWSGFDWSEPGLTGDAGELYGISGARVGEMAHATVLAWPDRGGYLMIASETAGGDDTADAHLVMFSQRPEGPWSSGTDPWAQAGNEPGVGIFQTYFGSDPARPWEIQPDGDVRAYTMVQPTFGSFADFDIALDVFEPSMAATPTFVFNDYGICTDLDVQEYVPDPTDMGTTEVPVAGGVYLLLYVAGGAPGLWTTDGTDWSRYPVQPPIGALVAPADYTAAGARAVTFLRAGSSTFQGLAPESTGGGGGGGVSLGTTSTTAHRGDHGAAAYTHSQLTSGNPHSVTKADVGLDSVTNDAQLKAASNLSDVASAATARNNLGSSGTLGHRDGTTALTGTTTPTSLLASTVTVPAIPVGSTLSLEVAGRFLNNTGANRSATVGVKLGSTTMIEMIPTGTGVIGSNASDRTWRCMFTMALRGAGDVDAIGTSTAIGSTAGPNIVTNTSTAALESGGTLNVVGTHSAATAAEIQVTTCVVTLATPRS